MSVLTTHVSFSTAGLRKFLGSPFSFTVHFFISANVITRISLEDSNNKEVIECFVHHSEESENLIREILSYMENYSLGKIEEKNFPLDLSYFSLFTVKTLEEMKKIPLGKTATYKSLAQNINNPKASRAVGNVCRRNPFPLLIPCHRVLPINGSVGNYAFGSALKEKLLSFEKALN